MYCPQPMLNLIQCLSALPGIGEKTATRLALFIMNQPEADALQLARSIIDVKEKVHLCSRCFNFTDNDECAICRNPSRDAHLLCVVETPGDLMSIEKAGHYKGLYHVLHGAIAPLDGVGPDQLKIKELLQRVPSRGHTGNNSRHQSHGERQCQRPLYFPAAELCRCQDYPDCPGSAQRRGHRVHRRGNAAQRF